MRFQNRGRHVIDLIFPISLFLVFAASSLAVLILAANIYRTSTSQAETNDQVRTALSYITEKVRQNDAGGVISIQQVDGTNCLVLTGNYNDTLCHTYIYQYEDTLKELFITDGTKISLKSGKDIIAVRGLTMKNLNDALYQFSCKDKNGITVTSIVSERSVK